VCVILFGLHAHADYPLIVAANRDEWFHRPTAAAAFWEDAPDVLAGRDLEQLGTWMGVTRGGRFAAVTNVREAGGPRAQARSRGNLVSGFLLGDETAAGYVDDIHGEGAQYNGFNLLVGDASAMAYTSNKGLGPLPVAPGIHGVSNDLLDTAWPKVVQGKAQLAAALAGPVIDPEFLFDILADRAPAPDEALPRTGVPFDRERALSALHVLAGDYGTRTATVLLVRRDGGVWFRERTFDRSAIPTGEVTQEFRIARP